MKASLYHLSFSFFTIFDKMFGDGLLGDGRGGGVGTLHSIYRNLGFGYGISCEWMFTRTEGFNHGSGTGRGFGEAVAQLMDRERDLLKSYRSYV